MTGKYYLANNSTNDGLVDGKIYGPSFLDYCGDEVVVDDDGDERSVYHHLDQFSSTTAHFVEVPAPETPPTTNPFLKTVTAVVGGTYELPYGCEIELVENCGNTVYIRVSDCAMNKEDVTVFARILSEIAEAM